MIWFLVIGVPIAVLIFHYLYTCQEFFVKAYKLPGPRRLPLLGNALEVGREGFDVLKLLARFVKEGDGFSAAWFGYNLTVLVSTPEYLQTLCTCPSTTYRSDHYEKIAEILGPKGILTCSGAQWKQCRKDVMSTFGVTPMDLIVTNMRSGAEYLIGFIKQLGNRAEPTAMYLPLRITTARTVLRNVVDDESINDEALGVILEKLTYTMDVAFLRQFEMLGRYDVTFFRTARGQQNLKFVEELAVWVNDLLNRCRSNYDRLKAESQPIPNVWAYNMFEKYPERPVSSFCDEFYHIFVAGLDTTAGTMGYVLLMLALHPELQDKVYEEIKEVDSLFYGRPTTHDDLKHFQLLERVIKETLRLFPTIALHGRVMIEDTYYGKHLVPKGANVVTLATFQCRNPKLFSDPLKFQPDRFLPENYAKLPPYAYSAFGGGPRSCIGNRYAMAGMRMILSDVLREYSVRSSYQSIDEIMQNERVVFTLTDAKGYPLMFQPRIS